jgi:hypothetical protein
MSPRTSLRTLLALAAIGGAIFAVHCSSDTTNSPSSCAFSDTNPSPIRHLTSDQQALLSRASDHAKSALSAAEWRYLFKLRYQRFPRAAVETDPVVIKALTAIAQEKPSCTAGATAPKSADLCERFVNADRCWTDFPVAASTVTCFMWSMMVAGGAGCPVPSASSAAALHVDAQAWDDAQDGHETADCEAPCIAGGGCTKGA